MKLATIRTADRTAAVRVDGDAARRHRRSLRRRRAAGRTRTGGCCADGRRPHGAGRRPTWTPVVPTPGEGRVCRAELPEPHPGDGPATCPSTPPCSRSSPTRSSVPPTTSIPAGRGRTVDWEGELVVVVGAAVRGADSAEAAEPPSPATPSSTTSPCGTGSSAPGNGCRARPSSHHPGRPGPGHHRRVAARPRDSSAPRSTARCAEGRHRRPGLRPGRRWSLRLPDDHPAARRHDRHRHPRRRRPRPQATPVPGARLRPDRRIDGIGTLHNTCVAVDARGRRAGAP